MPYIGARDAPPKSLYPQAAASTQLSHSVDSMGSLTCIG